MLVWVVKVRRIKDNPIIWQGDSNQSFPFHKSRQSPGGDLGKDGSQGSGLIAGTVLPKYSVCVDRMPGAV